LPVVQSRRRRNSLMVHPDPSTPSVREHRAQPRAEELVGAPWRRVGCRARGAGIRHRFQSCDSAEEVLDSAKVLLDVLNGAMRAATRAHPVTCAGIYEFLPNGQRRKPKFPPNPPTNVRAKYRPESPSRRPCKVGERRIRERSKFMKLLRFLPGRGSAGSWRHQDDTGTVAPRKPTSSWAPADRKALARSRLLNDKDLLRTSAAPAARRLCIAAVTLPKGHSIYRGLRADRRTAFNARLWLAATARFDTLGGFTRDALFETRNTFGALRRRALAIAAGASCSSAIAAGASSCALTTATVSWIKIDVV
jgi:hypothetical protein